MMHGIVVYKQIQQLVIWSILYLLDKRNKLNLYKQDILEVQENIAKHFFAVEGHEECWKKYYCPSKATNISK